MKNLYYLLITLVLFCSIPIVKAATITEAKYQSGQFEITGTGSGEIQVVLFGLDNQPLYLTTTSSNNDLWTITLPQIANLVAGTYTIKASDYDGTNISTKTVEIIEEENVQTYDNVGLFVTGGIICLVGLIITGRFIYQNKTIKKTKPPV